MTSDIKASSASCPRCDEVTWNLCACCGFLKSPGLEHCGQVPEDLKNEMRRELHPEDRAPRWAMPIALIVATIGGLIMGLCIGPLVPVPG